MAGVRARLGAWVAIASRRIGVAAVACAAVVALMATPASAVINQNANWFPTVPPSIKLKSAALLSPGASGTAEAWYNAQTNHTTHTNGIGSLNIAGFPNTAPPNEVAELARALHGDPDQIYKWVRNNVEIVWEFGLQKGSLGAIVDKSGTAFDQAKLMVDLIRASSYPNTDPYQAKYLSGTITLSGPQFQAWSNLTDATAACQMLAAGGIPAAINGTTSSDCSGYSHATITSVVLEHIWVQVTIGGQSYVYDPAYKDHTFKTGLNLAGAMGMTAGKALTDATSGAGSGTASGVSYVQGVNATSLNSDLTTWGSSLLAQIKSLGAPEVEDVVGGEIINRQELPTGGLRQTSLTASTNPVPYTAATADYTWTDIPDTWRTTLGVQIVKNNTGGTSAAACTIIPNTTCSTQPVQAYLTLFVDEIYGRKLVFNTNFEAGGGCGGNCSSPGNFADWAAHQTFIGTLQLLDEAGVGPTLASFSNSDPAALRDGTLTLNANHPYAASANGTATADGTYADEVVTKYVRMVTPFTIVHAWGDANGLAKKWGHRTDLQAPFYPLGC
jgi:hypothetical protein